jgi:DNA-binding NtrC family response regulator
MRAKRCYTMKLAPENDNIELSCDGSCHECEYYREVHGQRTNVLVVTKDLLLTSALQENADKATFNLKITDCEYNCSAVIHHFRPDFVFVDNGLGRKVSGYIRHHMVEDPRIPHVRVIMAGDNEGFPVGCDKEVFARIEKPFGITEITECIYHAAA